MKIKFALKYIMGQEAKSEKSRKCDKVYIMV